MFDRLYESLDGMHYPVVIVPTNSEYVSVEINHEYVAFGDFTLQFPQSSLDGARVGDRVIVTQMTGTCTIDIEGANELDEVVANGSMTQITYEVIPEYDLIHNKWKRVLHKEYLETTDALAVAVNVEHVKNAEQDARMGDIEDRNIEQDNRLSDLEDYKNNGPKFITLSNDQISTFNITEAIFLNTQELIIRCVITDSTVRQLNLDAWFNLPLGRTVKVVVHTGVGCQYLRVVVSSPNAMIIPEMEVTAISGPAFVGHNIEFVRDSSVGSSIFCTGGCGRWLITSNSELVFKSYV